MFVLNVDLKDRDLMGMVAATLKVMLESPEVDAEAVKKKILKNLSHLKDTAVHQVAIKPMAFGLKIIEVLIMKPDTGGTSDAEKLIAEIEGVESVETGDITLV